MDQVSALVIKERLIKALISERNTWCLRGNEQIFSEAKETGLKYEKYKENTNQVEVSLGGAGPTDHTPSEFIYTQQGEEHPPGLTQPDSQPTWVDAWVDQRHGLWVAGSHGSRVWKHVNNKIPEFLNLNER